MEKKGVDMAKAKVELLAANKAYIECIEKNFLPRFFNQEKVRIDEVCVNELKKMKELDQLVYGKFEWPASSEKEDMK